MCSSCTCAPMPQIDNEEYGDALQLARTYQLDCDLVYQRQWITSPISKATIEDYLVSTGDINILSYDTLCSQGSVNNIG